MAAKKSRVNLSDALDELFPEQQGPEIDRDAVWIDRGLIEPNPHQPRRHFSESSLQDLGASLALHGQLQACVVRSHPEKTGYFQLVSGERRWRASAPEYGNVARLRCTIREVSDAEALRLALAENVHREELTLVERAHALVQMKESEPGFTWDDVAAQANLSKRRILHLVDLLKLPAAVLERIEQGSFNEKHARAFSLLHKDPDAQNTLLKEIEKQELSGNAALAWVEKLSKHGNEAADGTSSAGETADGGSAIGRGSKRAADLAPMSPDHAVEFATLEAGLQLLNTSIANTQNQLNPDSMSKAQQKRAKVLIAEIHNRIQQLQALLSV